MEVDEGAGIVPGYDLKLNSYDLGVDIELHDAVQRLRFEHPEVGAVVVTGAPGGVFCAGANIRMLARSDHSWKVNFCKFTNETRNAIEDATAHSGQTCLAAINGTAAGGGKTSPTCSPRAVRGCAVGWRRSGGWWTRWCRAAGSRRSCGCGAREAAARSRSVRPAGVEPVPLPPVRSEGYVYGTVAAEPGEHAVAIRVRGPEAGDEGWFLRMTRELDDMSKGGGIWVSPMEVEARLLQHESVGECAVVAYIDGDGLEKPVACVVPAAGRVVDARELIAFCRDGLASFKQPREVVVLEEPPKTATGKIQRGVARRLAADRLGKD
nr:enoyl-CoA hydratase-related protein [Nonomuraea sp. FMUSA5-5]